MPRIASDPALDIEPDFTSATFEGIRNRIIGNTQLTHDEAANELATGWQQDRDIRLAAWTLQVNEETRLAAEAAQAERELLEQERVLLEQEAEKERRETEKKKPKINDFQAGASVGDTLTHRPSQYAIHKLKSFEYVELWYFSPDGCREAADEAKSAADSTFGFTKVDDFIALKPVAAFKPSRKVIQDHSLEWRQFDMAKNSFLLYMNKLKWPEKHQRAITMFFMNVVSHPQRSEPFGERALLLYAARVRRDWHDTLALDNAFDISVFNTTLLKNLAEEVWNKLRLESLTEFQLAMSSQGNGRESHTSSHRNQARSSTRPTRSRSRSPARNSSGRLPPRSSSPNRQRPRQDPKRPSQDKHPFQGGAASSGHHACALCLGRFAHNIHKCKSDLLWDNKTPTSCRRSAEGRLVNAQGLQLCYDWQRPNGCASTSKDHIHECSGCGNTDHGAQKCPRGQEV